MRIKSHNSKDKCSNTVAKDMPYWVFSKSRSLGLTSAVVLLFVVSATFFASCEKHLLSRDPSSDPFSNFDYLWHEVNNKYSYLDYKSVDWDDIYHIYRQKIYDDMREKELFGVLADMLYELKDGHVNLSSSFDRSRNWDWYLNYPPNFNANIVYRNYLGKDYLITGPFHNTIIDSVLYVYYSSFGNNFSSVHLDELIERAGRTKGIIFDIRSNGGGASSNAISLASAFTTQSYTYGYSRIKNGPGKDDFSAWRQLIISPRDGSKYSGQIIVLCNRNSYSASNNFALMMKTLPNAILIGDNTGGGGGTPAFGELPNGWLYRFSVTQTITPGGEHVENGISVDHKVELEAADEANGIDSIIEAALEKLR